MVAGRWTDHGCPLALCYIAYCYTLWIFCGILCTLRLCSDMVELTISAANRLSIHISKKVNLQWKPVGIPTKEWAFCMNLNSAQHAHFGAESFHNVWTTYLKSLLNQIKNLTAADCLHWKSVGLTPLTYYWNSSFYKHECFTRVQRRTNILIEDRTG